MLKRKRSVMDDLETDYSYQVLKRAIYEIDEAENALSLSELSTRMGMSRAHFQRLFSNGSVFHQRNTNNILC